MSEAGIDGESLFFWVTPTQTPGLENLGLHTPSLVPKSDSDSDSDLLCDMMIAY